VDTNGKVLACRAGTQHVKIVIVEDERIVAMSLQRQLAALGYQVIGNYPSGRAAIDSIAQRRPDLVLMDIRLEGDIDGIQATAEIHQRCNVPVVYLSAFSDTETLARAKVTEPFAYILKPIDERELHVVVETALYKHRLESERTAMREAELRRQEERLRSLETLAAGIAHEINNPVGTILLAAEMGLASDEHVQQSLANIVADAKRCGKIVRSVLRFARGESMDMEQADLNRVIREASQAVSEYLEQSAVSLAVDLSQGLPPVKMNSGAIEQVVENLLRNAADASTSGDTIELRSEIVDNAAQVTVRDRGTGIAPDVLPHIREPFYTTRRTMGGTGLGLSIAHGIVTEHGGIMSFDSAVGEGTTVTVKLPVKVAD